MDSETHDVNARGRGGGDNAAQSEKTPSMNAAKHGIYSRNLVAGGEPPADGDAFLEAVRKDLRPNGTVQEEIVFEIASLLWRKRRVRRVENGYINTKFEAIDDPDPFPDRSHFPPSSTLKEKPTPAGNCGWLGPYADLVMCYIQPGNYAGIDLDHAYSYASNFLNPDLTGANFAYAYWPANFVNDDLTDANFSNAQLVNNTISESDLTGVNFTGVDLSHVTWDSDTCPDGTFSDYEGHTCINDLGP